MWSLAIEEQFYLVWPLAMAGLLRLARGSRRVLAVPTIAVALISAVAMGMLYRPGVDPSRVYYGTDTRAHALLVGAALAMLLSRWSPAIDGLRGRLLQLVGVASLLAVLAACAVVDARSSWMYRGGYLGVAVVVAALLASVTRASPGLAGVVLSTPPLRWIGSISYGLYLWHWPVDVFVSSERTGLHGIGLTALRFATTFACAIPSYYLVERPIRTGALRGWRVRLALPATAITVAAGTALVTAGALPAGAVAERAARRSRAQTGADVLLVGDSVAFTLGAGFQGQTNGVKVVNGATSGCGLLSGHVGEGPVNRRCATTSTRWRAAADRFRPSVALALFGIYELYDRVVDGRFLRFGTSEFDTFAVSDLERIIRQLSDDAPRVVLLNSPYYAPPPAVGTRPAEAAYDEKRVDHWNQLLQRVAARHSGVVTLIDLNKYLAPHGHYVERRGPTKMRSDGTHFTLEGATIVADWLQPQLRHIIATAPPRSRHVSTTKASGPHASVPLPAGFPSDYPFCPGFVVTDAEAVGASAFHTDFELQDAAACWQWLERELPARGYRFSPGDVVLNRGQVSFILQFGTPNYISNMGYNEVDQTGVMNVVPRSG